LIGQGADARAQLLITFLSTLELGRMGFVTVFQNETYGDIYIEAKKQIESNALARVQEFDSADSEQVASSIINTAIDEKIDMYETMMAETEEVEQLALVDAVPVGEEHVVEADTELFESPDVATDDEIAAAEAELDRSSPTPEPEAEA
jgi:segregation and condensation protein A